MNTVSFIGHGLVWDADKRRVLCRFTDGVFTTSDEYVIGKLEKQGYTKVMYTREDCPAAVAIDKMTSELSIIEKPKRGRPKNA